MSTHSEQEFTHEQSLLLIEQMITTAKQEQKDDGQGWILWGWMIFAASIFSFLNEKFDWVAQNFFWNVFGALSILLLIVGICRIFVGKKDRVRTYTKDLFTRLNRGFFISLALIVVSMNMGVDPLKGFSLLLGLYGFWILIYGTVLKFRPSVIGAYITWALAFLSLFLERFDHVMAVHAIAVLCGYIIPGYLARQDFNKLKQDTVAGV
jgi:hypothetical protein